MKILIRQFLGKNHSWSVCGWGLAKALIKSNHQVDLFSTDGIKNLPIELKNNIIGYVEENNPTKIYGKLPENNYDCQISYTAMKNFPLYLNSGNKNKFGIWCYEWGGKNVLPNGFAKHYQSCDYILAPSYFAKKVFIDSGVPENKIKTISHGLEDSFFNSTETMMLPTKKKFKILSNIAQNHLRKNIPGLLEAYGKAFTKNDDVCLILKAKHKNVLAPFEVSLQTCLELFYKKYPNHAELKLFTEFIPDISKLYRSVDAIYNLPHCEGFFFFPGLEAIASGKLVIAPNWGGQIDFLNESNSLLVSGKEVQANPKSMYWESKPNAKWFDPSIDDAVNKLNYAYNNYKEINEKIELYRDFYKEKYSWESISKEIINLCQ